MTERERPRWSTLIAAAVVFVQTIGGVVGGSIRIVADGKYPTGRPAGVVVVVLAMVLVSGGLLLLPVGLVRGSKRVVRHREAIAFESMLALLLIFELPRVGAFVGLALLLAIVALLIPGATCSRADG